MAILQHEVVESNSGFAKEIEESAITMIFDNLQKSQYNKPIQSTVREIACNGLDSIKERDAAKQILSGAKKEEDYFIRRDEAIYKDSNFNIDYYDSKWLSDKKDIVITYHDNGTTGDKDFISFKDWGVGLGDKRLQNSLKLGWSSKRNAKLAIGKFGIGAKAPLSTGVDSYRMISTYNGRKFILDIYSHKVDSVVPKFNLKEKKKNKAEDWDVKKSDGSKATFKVYYEDTKDKNSVEVIVVTKKHHKQQYIDAIKSQLLYLKGVTFIMNSDGYESDINVTSKLLYEDDMIILAENHQYSKPHIVIDNVNYGYVDFQELELEGKLGNIGIKVGAADVSVTPSRESVVWNEQTRETVVNRFKEVVNIASTFVEKSLQEKDFVLWLKKCISTLSATDRNSTLGRLSQIVDKGDINPTFPGDKTIKYSALNTFFSGYKVSNLQKSYDYKLKKEKVQREDITSWSAFNFDKLYIQIGKSSHHKNVYLNAINNNNRITIIQPLELAPDTKLNKKQKEKYLAKQASILELFKKKGIPLYDDVVIPDDWKAKFDKADEEDAEEAIKSIPLTPAQQRKLNEATVFKYPKYEYAYSNSSNVIFSKDEIKIKQIASYDEQDNLDVVVYGFAEDRALLEFVFKYIDNNKNVRHVKILSIAMQNEKYYKDLEKSVYVKDLFKNINLVDKTIGVNELIRKYNTVRTLDKKFEALKFLNGYEGIDTDVYDKYKELTTYLKGNYIGDLRSSAKSEIDSYLDKVTEFQLFVVEVDGNPKLVGDKSMELFGTKDFKDAHVIDMEIFKKYKELLSYAEPIQTILNHMPVLTDNLDMNQEVETEIRNYVNFKLNLE